MAKWVENVSGAFLNLDNFVYIFIQLDKENEKWEVCGHCLESSDELAGPCFFYEFSEKKEAQAYIKDLLN